VGELLQLIAESLPHPGAHSRPLQVAI